jgi:mannose-6-phosphate isomerase-like protein (cupin superfamily)
VATKGQVLDDGAEKMEFLATAQDTAGELVAARVTAAVGRPAPPEHEHPKLEETFHVERGRMGYVSGRARRVAELGETVVIPPGTRHTFWNAGEEPLVVLAEVRPAMRFEDFAETIHVLIRTGELRAGRVPRNPLPIAVIAHAYREEWRLSSMPAPVRALLPALAWIGRRLGYRAYRPDLVGTPAL